ncbi:hypothetical protein CBL_08163 [Carabus blaptoides fortunei]
MSVVVRVQSIEGSSWIRNEYQVYWSGEEGTLEATSAEGWSLSVLTFTFRGWILHRSALSIHWKYSTQGNKKNVLRIPTKELDVNILVTGASKQYGWTAGMRQWDGVHGAVTEIRHCRDEMACKINIRLFVIWHPCKSCEHSATSVLL